MARGIDQQIRLKQSWYYAFSELSQPGGNSHRVKAELLKTNMLRIPDEFWTAAFDLLVESTQ